MSSFLSISENTISIPKVNYSFDPKRPIILCDFDGTISLKDVTDILLTKFGKEGCEELEEQWVSGVIGSQECMSKQIALLDANIEEINEALAEVEIDPYFKDFVKLAQSENINVQVVSDGLDYSIESILARHGIDLPVFANKLLHDGERSWRLTFPYSNKGCIKASGNCKCNHLKLQRKHFNPVLYVGDGTSDFCVSNKVDLVLAKDKLIDYCQKDTIEHIAINNFADAIAVLPRLLEAYATYQPHSRVPAMSIE